MSEHLDLESQKQHLLRTLRRQGINDQAVLSAMAAVPREAFVPEALRSYAYENRALAIGMDQTISQPYIVGLMTQSLQLTGTERVLEIGTGSGYQAAILSRLCHAVYTVERIAELAEIARKTLTDLGIANVAYRVGDGTEGWPELAPFDRIIVTAAAPEAPRSLLTQLADSGVLVIPIGDEERQTLTAIGRRDGELTKTALCECRFVPLIGSEGWDGRGAK